MSFIENKYKDIFHHMYYGTVRKQGIFLDGELLYKGYKNIQLNCYLKSSCRNVENKFKTDRPAHL